MVNVGGSVFERVQFRLLVCSECGTLLCWVNPRPPNYCPECGKYIFPTVRSNTLVSDANATLKYKEVLP